MDISIHPGIVTGNRLLRDRKAKRFETRSRWGCALGFALGVASTVALAILMSR